MSDLWEIKGLNIYDVNQSAVTLYGIHCLTLKGNAQKIYINLISKAKAVPLQAWSGPEGSRKLRFPYFMKTVRDGGKVASLTHLAPLPLGNTPGTHFC